MVMQEENLQPEPIEQDTVVDLTPEPEPEVAEGEQLSLDDVAPVGETVVDTQLSTPEAPPVEEAKAEVSAEQAKEERQRLADLEELGRRRREEEETQRKQQLLQRARAKEQNLLNDGFLPEQARRQVNEMVSYENKIHDVQQKSMELLQFAEGRNNAALHFGVKHGLIPKEVVDDINVLLRSQSPDDMEFEAKRMSELRQTRAEISRLKQGQVKPQTFDNSQGSAEAVNSDDRLIDAYLNGDRSEAAVQAAKRLTFGS